MPCPDPNPNPAAAAGADRGDGDSMSEVIDLYKRDVDRSLLRDRLKRTPEERLIDLMRMQRLAEEVARAGRRARDAEGSPRRRPGP
ncbi:MAG: hypothetical protein ACYTFH_09915 [Planctomycetota bacterium]|jgi:hypothetical protein